NLFVVSTIATVLFLGGGHGPFPGFDEAVAAQIEGVLHQISGPIGWFFNSLIDGPTLVAALWVIVKSYALVIFAIVFLASLPRFRIDQLMDFGWKRLIPLSLLLFIAVTFVRELV